MQRLRVELVGVEVEHRMRIGLAGTAQPADDPRDRDRAPVAAAADRHDSSGDPGHAHRQLPQLRARRKLQAIRSVRDAAEPVRHLRRVVLARVVAEAELGQRFVGPRRLAVDRERRCTVRDGTAAAGLLDQLRRGAHVLRELLPRLAEHALVREPVARGLVAARGDLARELRVPANGHAEKEEGRGRAQLVQQVE